MTETAILASSLKILALFNRFEMKTKKRSSLQKKIYNFMHFFSLVYFQRKETLLIDMMKYTQGRVYPKWAVAQWPPCQSYGIIVFF